ncbi:uncharacterized protein LOC144882529 isoform X1 [Branchiostoma floridae x Branchiostoma japonicum]
MADGSIIRQVRPNAVLSKDASFKFVKNVERPDASIFYRFNYVTSFAVTAEGDIVVAENASQCLPFLDKDGSVKRDAGAFSLSFNPEGVLALTNGELLVTGDGHRIWVRDKEGVELRYIEVTGAEEAEETTKGITVDGLGRIIVTIGHQIFVLSPSGDVMLKFGDKDEGQQNLGSILHVAVNSSNQIIVSDYDNGNVKVFDPEGHHLFTCDLQRDSEAGESNHPMSVIADSEDNIIVVDIGTGNVSMFSPDGKFIRHVLTRENNELWCPIALALTNEGHLFVSDNLDIKLFSASI